MGRPAKHSADDFVDAAIALFADDGPRAIMLNSVATAIGASNGSVYHRFPDRPSLLAAVWLRTANEFETAYLDHLRGVPSVSSVVAAGAWIGQWCSEHPQKALVLEAGVRSFAPESWPDSYASALTNDRFRHELSRYTERLAGSTSVPADQITFAMIDLPLAVVRRAINAGNTPNDRDADLIKRLVAAALRK